MYLLDVSQIVYMYMCLLVCVFNFVWRPYGILTCTAY